MSDSAGVFLRTQMGVPWCTGAGRAQHLQQGPAASRVSSACCASFFVDSELLLASIMFLLPGLVADFMSFVV